MSRRHLSLVVVALASLAVSACSSSPTAPRTITPAAGASRDGFTPPPADTTHRTGWSDSNG